MFEYKTDLRANGESIEQRKRHIIIAVCGHRTSESMTPETLGARFTCFPRSPGVFLRYSDNKLPHSEGEKRVRSVINSRNSYFKRKCDIFVRPRLSSITNNQGD